MPPTSKRSSTLGRCAANPARPFHLAAAAGARAAARLDRGHYSLLHRRQDISRHIHTLSRKQHGVVVITARERDDQVQVWDSHGDLAAVSASEERANLPALVVVRD